MESLWTHYGLISKITLKWYAQKSKEWNGWGGNEWWRKVTTFGQQFQ